MSSDYAFPRAPPVGAPAPLRRRVQPPALSTTLSGTQRFGTHLGVALTPASPPSSSNSPFSSYNPSSMSSPSTLSRGASPMASRHNSGLSAPYNPQQWGQPGGNSPNVGSGPMYTAHSGFTSTASRATGGVTEASGMEASMPSPPPPYSPRRPQQPQSVQSSSSPVISPAQTVSPGTNPSSYNTPISAATTISPASGSAYQSSPRPMSVFHQVSSPNIGSSSSSQSFPPPPPLQGQRSSSASRTPNDRPQPLFSLSSRASRSRASNTASPVSAIDALQHNTARLLSRTSIAHPIGHSPVVSLAEARESPPDLLNRPPSSRRAASTGDMMSRSATPTSSRSESRSNGQSAWTPGMPLPPPPPGPPPPNARSQSMSRSSEGSSSSRNFSTPIAAPVMRRPPAHGTSLDPVPPTPADWVDEDSIRRERSPNRLGRPLHIDTNNISENRTRNAKDDRDLETSTAPESPPGASMTGATPYSGNLSRSPAVREGSVKGIRERRSESRTGKGRVADLQSTVEPSKNSWVEDMDPVKPADLVFPRTSGTLIRRRAATKSGPRSAKSIPSAAITIDSASSANSLIAPELGGSAHSTPRPDTADHRSPREPFAPTPPFSPGREIISSPMTIDEIPSLPPTSLPTPPPQHYGEFSKSARVNVHIPEQRPVSHIFHTPNSDASVQPPLNPSRPSSRQSEISRTPIKECDVFARSAMQRHNTFAEREATAKSDQERVELFTEFVVTESRIRRERYAKAIDEMGSEILELTRDLFRPYTKKERSTAITASPATSNSSWSVEHSALDSHRGSLDAAVLSATSSNLPEVGSGTPPSASSVGLGRPDSAWWGGYMPTLSPIPSMAVSDIPDEEDSRGRPSSRWWEASQEGSNNGGGSRGMERSKRESKYMGVPKQVRESLQWETNGSSPAGFANGTAFAGPSTQTSYGENEYPPEKTGWYEQEYLTPPPPNPPSPYTPALSTPVPGLDVSRLVTLPPPYPRHYPAVNNNHPDLVSIRTIIRSLSDFDEATETKERYSSSITVLREEGRQKASQRRSQLRSDIQRQIEAGNMTYAAAARVEAEADVEESDRKKERAQAEFEVFQGEVVKPLHTLFSERIARATFSIDELRSKLFVDAQERSPNLTQEEGDEQPELLEKLTALKWLFEAREQLHRETYELLTDRNEKYMNMVTTPYRQCRNTEKVLEAEEFFRQDGQDRKVLYEKETLARFEEFNDLIEQNVIRGVEVQLSAFWDIAPALLAVCEKIPHDLQTFTIRIPPVEFAENPSYHSYPLQYLHSLLTHSEKSTYQFIESQTNLLCLLHEVKSSVMAAGCRLLQTQRYLAGEDFVAVEEEMGEVKGAEEKKLTDDLQEKVRIVEGQWGEALGAGLDDVKERVREFLTGQGGWCEDDDES
ncbi:MAG: hypothetical protein M1827_005565 [Pycnora praestabilis]|nr:MAG: hypothetical protein M1827_005565 [Pycnora praestabilis]